MSKLFYSLEETAQKLNRSTKDVMDLVRSGQLQEYKDKEKVMFRCEAVDAMAVDEGDLDMGTLNLGADLKDASGSAFAASLGDSGSLAGLDVGSAGTPGSPTGASAPNDLLDLGSLSFDDPAPTAPPVDLAPAIDLASSASSSAVAFNDPPSKPANKVENLSSFELSSGLGSSDPAPFSLSGSGGAAPINLADSSMDDSLASGMAPRSPSADTVGIETISSGSGLLDLTREADDTSIGAALLDEVVNADEASSPGSGGGLLGEGGSASGSASASTDAMPEAASSMAPTGAAFAPMVLTAYDGKWSGTGVGLLLGAAASVGLAATVLLASAFGAPPTLSNLIAGDIWMWTGGLAGGTAVFGLIGFFVGRATE